jgi:hypothetical protein
MGFSLATTPAYGAAVVVGGGGGARGGGGVAYPSVTYTRFETPGA